VTQVAKRTFGAPYDPPEHLWLAGPLQSVRGSAGGRKGTPETEASSPEGARSRGERQGFAGPRLKRWTNGASRKRAPMTISRRFKQQTLVVNGSNDVIMPTVNSFIMPQNIPCAMPNHLPRLPSWVAVSISRAVCAARHAVPKWLNTSRKRETKNMKEKQIKLPGPHQSDFHRAQSRSRCRIRRRPCGCQYPQRLDAARSGVSARSIHSRPGR